jgi:hypothetical protein
MLALDSQPGCHHRQCGDLAGRVLNLASEGAKALPNIRALDGDRRIWVASLIIGINELSKDELLRAAGREKEA